MSRYREPDEETVAALRKAIEAGEFPGVTFEQAMKLALTGGIVPASGLPVESILRLDDWLRGHPTGPPRPGGAGPEPPA